MIDGLNFWIGIVFAFAGISILISALRYYLQISFSKYILVASAGLAFFLIGGNLILNSPIEFNPALHECTAMGWKSNEYKNLYSECYGTCNFLRYEFEINTTKEACNKFCVFGKQKCVSFRAKTPCELGNENYTLTLDSKITCYDENCSSYVAESNYIPTCREKTECEKGNPEYVLEKGTDRFLSNTTFIDGYDFICENCTDEETLKKAEEGLNNIYRYVSYGSAQDVCRQKTVEELEVDYCKENPESDRCYCVEQREVGAIYNYAGQTTLYDCVSAVPISEKLYCDENPSDTKKCDCIVRTCAGIPIKPRMMILNNTDLQCHVYDWKDKELKFEVAKIPTVCVGAVPKVTG